MRFAVLAALALGAASSGCFSPGLLAEGGGVTAPASPDPAPALAGRIGVHPPIPDVRRVDFGIGYWQDGQEGQDRYGAYGSAMVFPVVTGLKGDTFRRFGIGLQGRTANHGDATGWGAGLQLLGEIGFAGQARAKNGVIVGAGAIGLYAEVARVQIGPTETWTASAGVDLRVPFMAGLVAGKGRR
jgi:hypothetical protein